MWTAGIGPGHSPCFWCWPNEKRALDTRLLSFYCSLSLLQCGFSISGSKHWFPTSIPTDICPVAVDIWSKDRSENDRVSWNLKSKPSTYSLKSIGKWLILIKIQKRLRWFLRIALDILTGQNFTPNQRAHEQNGGFSIRLACKRDKSSFFSGMSSGTYQFFSLNLNVAITFFLYRKYRTISIAE